MYQIEERSKDKDVLQKMLTSTNTTVHQQAEEISNHSREMSHMESEYKSLQYTLSSKESELHHKSE